VGVVTSNSALVRGVRTVTLSPDPRDKDRGPITVKTDTNGRYSFRDVPAGTYLLKCVDGGQTSGQRVSVRPGLNNFNCQP
jgi:hypothetical protein